MMASFSRGKKLFLGAVRIALNGNGSRGFGEFSGAFLRHGLVQLRGGQIGRQNDVKCGLMNSISSYSQARIVLPAEPGASRALLRTIIIGTRKSLPVVQSLNVVRHVQSGSLACKAASDATVGVHGIILLKWKYSAIKFLEHYARCYFELSKARLSMFVVSTASVGFIMGSGEVVDWMGLLWTSVGTMLVASSANAFNQILEIKNDARMKRTMRRPLPAGRLGTAHACIFALSAGVLGVTLLAGKTNSLTAELGAANLLLYTLVYTPLKQIHHVNTWVGAVVGAIPPLMGWAAATGALNAGGCVLASAVYFWQFPHFMALAFLCRHDYAAGGYKMISLSDATGRRTAMVALRNCAYLLPLGFIAHSLGTTSGIFGVETLVLTAFIGATSLLFYLNPSTQTARRLFRSSLLYLPLFMTAMIVHRIPNSGSVASLKEAENLELVTPEGNSEEALPHEPIRKPCRPPIAFVSVAPFPFLPVPEYH